MLNKIEQQISSVSEISEQTKQCIKKQKNTVKMLAYTSSISKNLMMDLLDLAQADNNTFRLNEEAFSLRDIIQKAFKVVDHVAKLKNVALEAPVFDEYLKAVF